MSFKSASVKDVVMGFWEHVDELVRRFKIVLSALILSIAIGWLPTSISGITNPTMDYKPVLSLIMIRLKDQFLPHTNPPTQLIAGGMGDTVFAMAYLSFIIGILLASPVIFYEIYAFVRPGLYESERKVIVYYVGSFIGLLILGGVMSYFIVIPVTFKILIYFTMNSGAAPLISIKDFYNWIYTLFAVNSFIYTIPVFVVLLVQVGILPIKYLKGRKRALLYAAIFIIVWIFGPNPDPTGISDAIMMAPFFLVFEIGVFFAMRIDKKRHQAIVTTFGEQGPSGGTDKSWMGSTRNVSTCKFCNATTEADSTFCPTCGRAQA